MPTAFLSRCLKAMVLGLLLLSPARPDAFAAPSDPAVALPAAQARACAALKSGDLAGCTAIYDRAATMTTGRNTGNARAAMRAALQPLLRYHPTAVVTLTALRRLSPKAARVVSTEQIEYNIIKPPTRFRTPQGIALLNNTTHVTRRTTSRQEWRLSQGRWRIHAIRILKSEQFAVL